MARELPIQNGRMTTDLDAKGHTIKNLPADFCVKTVNGTAPDSSGAVVIPVGGEVVAPSVNPANAGKAADAYATGTGLASKFDASCVYEEYAEGMSYSHFAKVTRDGALWQCAVEQSSSTWVDEEWVQVPLRWIFEMLVERQRLYCAAPSNVAPIDEGEAATHDGELRIFPPTIDSENRPPMETLLMPILKRWNASESEWQETSLAAALAGIETTPARKSIEFEDYFGWSLEFNLEGAGTVFSYNSAEQEVSDASYAELPSVESLKRGELLLHMPYQGTNSCGIYFDGDIVLHREGSEAHFQGSADVGFLMYPVVGSGQYATIRVWAENGYTASPQGEVESSSALHLEFVSITTFEP